MAQAQRYVATPVRAAPPAETIQESPTPPPMLPDRQPEDEMLSPATTVQECASLASVPSPALTSTGTLQTQPVVSPALTKVLDNVDNVAMPHWRMLTQRLWIFRCLGTLQPPSP